MNMVYIKCVYIYIIHGWLNIAMYQLGGFARLRLLQRFGCRLHRPLVATWPGATSLVGSTMAQLGDWKKWTKIHMEPQWHIVSGIWAILRLDNMDIPCFIFGVQVWDIWAAGSKLHPSRGLNMSFPVEFITMTSLATHPD